MVRKRETPLFCQTVPFLLENGLRIKKSAIHIKNNRLFMHKDLGNSGIVYWWDSRDGAPFGAVGIGTWAVLSSIPEGARACGAEGRIALC